MIDINYARSILNKPGLLMLYLWVHFINIGYYIITIECGHPRKNIDWSICRPLSLFQTPLCMYQARKVSVDIFVC